MPLPLASMRYRDAMHRPLGLACALLSACGPSPGEESTTEAPARTTGAAASTGEPTTTTTIDTPTTTGDSTPTSTTSTGPTPTTSPDDDTSTGGTTGAPGQCGPPCDAPWIHEGDLEINAKTDPESLRCLVEVTKSLQISGLPGQLPPQLGNLRRVGRNVEVNYSDALTSLAGMPSSTTTNTGILPSIRPGSGMASSSTTSSASAGYSDFLVMPEPSNIPPMSGSPA